MAAKNAFPTRCLHCGDEGLSLDLAGVEIKCQSCEEVVTRKHIEAEIGKYQRLLRLLDSAEAIAKD